MEEALFILLQRVKERMDFGRNNMQDLSRRTNHLDNYMNLRDDIKQPISRASQRDQHIKLMLNVNPFSESI
jgi:hypothetical protein